MVIVISILTQFIYLFIYLFASDTHNLDHMHPYQLLCEFSVDFSFLRSLRASQLDAIYYIL